MLLLLPPSALWHTSPLSLLQTLAAQPLTPILAVVEKSLDPNPPRPTTVRTAAAAADGADQVNELTATAKNLPTTAHAHTLMSNSSDCSRGCNVAVHDNHGNGTSPNLLSVYYYNAFHAFMTATGWLKPSESEWAFFYEL
jgi:hypothetical protein